MITYAGNGHALLRITKRSRYSCIHFSLLLLFFNVRFLCIIIVIYFFMKYIF
uniref:Uncharacterized protein n=1 Tax=Heterorhabditis bacteriophora TaxID=37862 RepID=A0A1I7W857_HETBA